MRERSHCHVIQIVPKNLAFYSAGFMGLTAGLFGGSS